MPHQRPTYRFDTEGHTVVATEHQEPRKDNTGCAAFMVLGSFFGGLSIIVFMFILPFELFVKFMDLLPFPMMVPACFITGASVGFVVYKIEPYYNGDCP
jgi:hypothetical protein